MRSENDQNTLNLIGTVCPMAFVKARIHLDQLAESDITTLIFEDTPSNEPLLRSIEALGHKVLSETSHTSSDGEPIYRDHSTSSGTLHVINAKIQVKI